MVGFEPLGRGNCRLDTDGRERAEHRPFNRFVNLQGADGEAVDAATIGDVLAGAVIARGRGTTRVVSAQLATATSAHSDALQQRSSFSHGTTTGLMRARMGVGGDLCAIGLVGVPIDKALMVVRDAHLPLRARFLRTPEASRVTS